MSQTLVETMVDLPNPTKFLSTPENVLHEEIPIQKMDLSHLEIMGILGVGTYGIVKLAKHIPTGTSVALKVLSKEQIVLTRQQKHVVREKLVHSSMNHPFIVQLLGTLQDDDCLYLVEEFLQGGELYSILYSERSELTNGKNGLKEDDARFYLACILMAIQYIHEHGAIYRDLKLENLVLDDQGYPKVLDFGFAKPHKENERNLTLCGSIDYMAPEILLHQPHDQHVDIWSIGIVMYELLTGTTPFFHENQNEQGNLITSEPVTFPNGFEEDHEIACDLIRKLLEKNPHNRPHSIEEIKKHKFFSSYFDTEIKWKQLVSKEIIPPYVPQLNGPFDTSCFEIPEDIDDYIEEYIDDGTDWTDGF